MSSLYIYIYVYVYVQIHPNNSQYHFEVYSRNMILQLIWMWDQNILAITEGFASRESRASTDFRHSLSLRCSGPLCGGVSTWTCRG